MASSPKYRYVKRRWHILMSVIDCIGGWLWAIAGEISKVLSHKSSSQKTSPEKILLIQLDHFGDAILTTLILPLIQKHLPQAKLHVLASSRSAAVFQACDEIEQVHLFEWNRHHVGWKRYLWPFGILYWGWKLRGTDMAIDLRGEIPHALLMWITGAKERIGWNCGGGGFLLTKSPTFDFHRHEVLSRLALLETIHIQADDPETLYQESPLQRLGVKHQEDLLHRFPFLASTTPDSKHLPTIVIHIGTGFSSKTWPSEHWVKLIDLLQRETSAQFVFIGTSADHDRIQQIIHQISPEEENSANLVNLAGELTIPELCGLLSQAELMIGADSGPAHLSAVIGTQTLALFSHTNLDYKWRPWGKHVTVMLHKVPCGPCNLLACPLENHPCMTGLTPERVADSALKHLTQASLIQQELVSI